MNAGLSNLATLKAWLLNSTMAAGTDYDAQILMIGLGVAGLIERHCNRKLGRVVGDVEIFPADRTKHVVQRYPLETTTALVIEVKQVEQDGWATLPDLVINRLDSAGLLYFYGQQGWQRGMIRLTYTGGYWWEQREPADVGYPTAQPAGSTVIDVNLQLAWLMQCEHIWKQRDKLGLSIGEKPDSNSPLEQLNLLPLVKSQLQPFRRYQLS